MRTLAIALTIVVALVGSIWYVKADIERRTDDISAMRLAMQNRGASVASLARLQSDAEKAKQYLPQIEQMRTTRDQLLGFSTAIGFLAHQAGFSGTPKFQEAANVSAGGLQKTKFSLSLEGHAGLADLGTFLGLVEKSSYFVRFESVNTSQDGDVLRAVMEGYVISF